MLTHLVVLVGISALIWLTARLSIDKFSPQLGNNIANPFIILAMFESLEFFDFSWMANDRTPSLREVPVTVSPQEITLAALYYIGMLLIFLTGALVSINYFSKHKAAKPLTAISRADMTASAMIAGTFLAITLAYQAVTVGFSANIAEVSALKGLRSQDDPFLPMTQWAAVLAAGLYLNVGVNSRVKALVIVVAMAMFAFITGSRTLQFFVIIFGLTSFARLGFKIKRGWSFALMPIALTALTLYRFFFRAVNSFHGQLGDFVGDKGGALGVLFSSDEISFAEITSYSLFSLNPAQIDRYPLEGVLGLIMTPIPRSLLGDAKPLPAQATFNSLVSISWFDAKGGFVISPFIELYFELGVIFSFVGSFALGCVLGWLVDKASKARDVPYFWLGAVSSGTFIFIRTDMQDLGQFVWPLLIVTLGWKELSDVMKKFGSR